jgi:hypothetical protein
MNREAIDSVLAEMTPEELAKADRYIHFFVWVGSMTDDEAAEWRRRILAWQRFVLDRGPSPPN